MGRKRKARKSNYKGYYEKDASDANFYIPQTTLASRSKNMGLDSITSTDHHAAATRPIDGESSSYMCRDETPDVCQAQSTQDQWVQIPFSSLGSKEGESVIHSNAGSEGSRRRDPPFVELPASTQVSTGKIFPPRHTPDPSNSQDSSSNTSIEYISKGSSSLGIPSVAQDGRNDWNFTGMQQMRCFHGTNDQGNTFNDDCGGSGTNSDASCVHDYGDNFSGDSATSSEICGNTSGDGCDGCGTDGDASCVHDYSDNFGSGSATFSQICGNASDDDCDGCGTNGDASCVHYCSGDSATSTDICGHESVDSNGGNSEQGSQDSGGGGAGGCSSDEGSSGNASDSSDNEASEDGNSSDNQGGHDSGDVGEPSDNASGPSDPSDPGDDEDSSHNEDGTDASNNEDEEEYPDTFRRLKSELRGAFQNPLDVRVRISVGEILTNTLALSKRHNWNHSETADVLKFAASILKLGDALPDSRYMVDALFYSKKGMEYHFYCSECSHYLGNAPAYNDRARTVKCPNATCNHMNETGNLAEASYFVTFDLRGQIETLLSDPKIRSKLMNPLDFTEEPADGIMRDLHHGSSYREFAQFVRDSPTTVNCKVVSLTLSLDSATLSHFSKLSFCPCFISINELPSVIRMSNLLIAGLWFGNKKEIMDVFLPPIVKHIVHLSLHGFSVTVGAEVWLIKAFLIKSVADSVARCEIQGLHSHRGDFPCNWCHIEGEEFDTVRIFRYTDAPFPPRTIKTLLEDANEAIRRKEFVHGVKYLCLLSPAPMFHPVESFIVDQMHAKDEGITKMFLKAWLGEGIQPFAIGSAANKKKMKILMEKIKPPKECRKSIRQLEFIAFWTAREFENFEFFISIPLLVDILPVRYLKHFALYVQGCYILLNSEVPITAVPVAHQLLQDFRRDVEALYSPYMMTFNMHILEHFGQNTERHGPMFALSAYAFEAGIQHVKKMVHAGNYIPSQICRSLSEDSALLILKKYCETPATINFEKKINPKRRVKEIKIIGNVQLVGLHKNYRLSQEERFLFSQRELPVDGWEEYTYLKKEGCHYGPSPIRNLKTDNSFARLTSDQIIHIKTVLYNEDLRKILVVASRVRCHPSRFCPAAVIRYNANLCFQYIVDAIDGDVQLYDVSELATICFSLPFSHGHYLSPMPNIFNMF